MNNGFKKMFITDFNKTEQEHLEGQNIVWGHETKVSIECLPDAEQHLSVLPEKYLCVINEKIEWINNNKNHEKIKKEVGCRIDRINTIIGNNHHLCGIDCGMCSEYADDEGDYTFEDKVFCFTGKLANYTREEAQEIIEENDGIVTDSLSNKVDYLIVGKKPENILDKAKTMGIAILNEKALDDICEGFGPPYVLYGKRPHFNVNYNTDVFLEKIIIYPSIGYAKIYFTNNKNDCHVDYELDTVLQIDDNNTVHFVGENYGTDDNFSEIELYTKLAKAGCSDAKKHLEKINNK